MRKEMMDFELFREYIKGHIKEMLPEEYQDAEYEIRKITKNNNRKLYGLSIRLKDDTISPVIYLGPYYKAYKERDIGFAAIQEDIANRIKENMPVQDKLFHMASDMCSFEKMRDKVVMALVNFEKNKQMLTNVPHIRKEDLAVIYKALVMYPDTDPTATVNNKLMKEWGIDAGKLHELAMENSKRLFPARAATLLDTMRAIIPEEGMPFEMRPEELLGNLGGQMYVITNQGCRYGAAAVFYDDSILQRLSEKLGGGFYILPSSMDELIAVPESTGNVPELALMVKSVNETHVPEDIWLSDNVYRYDAKSRQISLADADLQELQREEEEIMRPRRSR